MLGDARHRVERPPRDRGEPAGGEHAAPELPAGLRLALSIESSLHSSCRPVPTCAGRSALRWRRSARRCGSAAGLRDVGGRSARHLPGGVAAPAFVRRDLLALHQEGVGGEHRAVAHRHAVVDHGADPEGAAGADRAAVGLEGVVLLGVALDARSPALRVTSSPMVTSVLLGHAGSRRRRPAGRSGHPAAARTTLLNGVPLKSRGTPSRVTASRSARAARSRGRRSSSTCGRSGRNPVEAALDQHEVGDGEQQDDDGGQPRSPTRRGGVQVDGGQDRSG